MSNPPDWRSAFWGCAGIGAAAVITAPTLSAEIAVAVFTAGCLLILAACIILAVATKRRRRRPNAARNLTRPVETSAAAPADPMPARPARGSAGIRILGGKRISLLRNRI